MAELVHGELEVEPGAVVDGQIGEGLGLENTPMKGEPESRSGTRTLHLMPPLLKVSPQKRRRRTS